MAEGEKVGGIYIEIEADVAKLLVGQKQAESALDSIGTTANSTSKALDGLDKESKSAGSSLSKIAGHAKSVDDSMQTLNTNVSAVAMAINQANSSAVASSMTLTQMNVALQALVASTTAASQSVQSTSTATSNATREFSRAEAIIEGLGNQIAILEEAMENGARSATVLAAQLRAGSAATEEEKKTIGDLAAAFFDLKAASDEVEKSASAVTAGFQRAESAISGLENDVSILSTEMQAGARSAAILAAQLNAGSGATQEQKSRIAELTGNLYDMREAQKSASRSAADAAKQLAQEANEATRIASIISDLSHQTSIFSAEQESGARSAAILAAQLRAGDAATQDQKAKIADLVGSLYDMKEAQNAATREAAEASKQLDLEAREAERISSVTDGLSQQIAILNEQQTNGARSAAILAAQLRLGAKASDEEKQKIGELTGKLFDMQRASAASSGGSKSWKSSMQQAGYQVQDFIVQVQGGQSALVAFSQQGSQLAGAFGPGGAVIGAVLALGSVLAGTLIASLNGGKNATDAMKDAISSFDQVISISQNGVAAYSDKFALLAKTNAAVATLMKQQAQLELQDALSRVSKEVQKASGDFISFGDSLVSSLGGGYASVKLFNDYLSTLEITTNDFSEAMKQAAASGQAGQTTMNHMIATVGALASKFQISDQQAYEFAKQLSDIAKNPSDEKLKSLISTLQEVGRGQSSGAQTAREYAKRLLEIATTSADASMRLKALKEMTDALTSSQDKALQQARQELFITKQTGSEKQKALAWRDAENQGLKDGTKAFRDYYNIRLQTYQQQEANAEAARNEKKSLKESESAAKSAASQQESIAQKLANLKQQSELAAGSTQELSREQAMLRAEQSLGKSASADQIQQARTYAAAVWETAAAIKARNAVPELKENADYNAQKSQLETLKDAKDAQGNLIISQQQYNQTSEQLEQQHQVNIAKIRAGQVVTPQQQAQGEIDPVQRLANQHAQELALIQQFETQKGQITANGLALMNAANTQYEQQRIAAQWALFTQQSVGYEALGAAVDAFGNQASNALTGIITGSMSASDALQSIGNTILNDVINTFVQMGIQQAKSAIMGASVQQATIAATTATQVGALATTTAASTASAGTTMAAWLPAALVASVGSFGAAAIIGGAALVGAFALSKTLAGGRKNGGPVSAGSMYQVGEGGMPEIYKASNGSQYMIPGDNGSVISNKDLRGSGGGGALQVTNNVYNYASGVQVDTRSTQNGSELLIETFVTDLQNGGPMSGQMESTYGLRRQASGDY